MPLDTGTLKIGPAVARKAALDYFKCYLDFKPEGNFSVVQYFICCKGMELALKSKHLKKKPKEVVESYDHNLKKLYADLPADDDDIQLSIQEKRHLKYFNQRYMRKDYEYFDNSPVHAVTPIGRRRPGCFAELARKVIGYLATAAP